MSDKLMPYGSPSNTGLSTKVATPVKINIFKPFGTSSSSALVVKAGFVPTPPKTPWQKVKRLNAGKR